MEDLVSPLAGLRPLSTSKKRAHDVHRLASGCDDQRDTTASQFGGVAAHVESSIGDSAYALRLILDFLHDLRMRLGGDFLGVSQMLRWLEYDPMAVMALIVGVGAVSALALSF